MDISSMLLGAKIIDEDGLEVGEVKEYRVGHARLVIVMADEDDEEEEDEPDDGERKPLTDDLGKKIIDYKAKKAAQKK